LHALQDTPWPRVAIAILLTAGSYLVLTFYDALALRYIRRPLPYKRTALPTFLSFVLSMNLGSLVGSVAFRYRIYAREGFTLGDVTKVFLFTAMTFWTGLLAVGGVVFAVTAPRTPRSLHLPWATMRPVGLLFLAIIGLYLGVAAIYGGRIPRLGRWHAPIPTLPLALAQIALASLDWILASGVFAALIGLAGTSYPRLLAAYMLAETAALASHVPGGVGVFETVALLFLSPPLGAAAVLGALVVFRAVYFVLPLLPALALIVVLEVAERRHVLTSFATTWGGRLTELVPDVLGLAVGFAAVTLLLSDALPPLPGRLILLERALPLPLVELSHFLASIVATLLLTLAFGLHRRLDAAYYLTVALLWLGAVLSLTKAFAYEQAIFLVLVSLGVLPARREFNRHSRLTREALTPGWVLSLALAVIATAWLGTFAYKHVEYSSRLWFTFALHGGGAPRALRALAGTAVVVLCAVLVRLVSASRRGRRPSRAALRRIWGRLWRRRRPRRAGDGLPGEPLRT